VGRRKTKTRKQDLILDNARTAGGERGGKCAITNRVLGMDDDGRDSDGYSVKETTTLDDFTKSIFERA
jgi:hypothetical protein